MSESIDASMFETHAVKVSDIFRRFADKLDDDAFVKFAIDNGSPNVAEAVSYITLFCMRGGYDVCYDKLCGYQPDGTFVDPFANLRKS